MIDLILFSKLLKDTQATMILTQKSDSKLEYYLIGRTLAYSIITNGICDGSIDKKQIILNIDLKLLNILLRKDFIFNLHVSDGKAIFSTVGSNKGAMNLTPLCIEKSDSGVMEIINNLITFLKRQELFKSSNNFDDQDLTLYNLEDIKILASLSNKTKEIIQVTKKYSVVELNGVIALLKTEGYPLAINGSILNTLLIEGGEFYKFGSKLYFISKQNNTFVIFNIVLPSTKVDMSIISKGPVQEFYTIDTKDIVDLIYNLNNNLQSVHLNFADSKLIMSNDTGELLTHNFLIKKAETVALQELRKTKKLNNKIEMATIRLPKQVCQLLPFFKGEIDVFIFKNKIIFRKNKLYLIFGR